MVSGVLKIMNGVVLKIVVLVLEKTTSLVKQIYMLQFMVMITMMDQRMLHLHHSIGPVKL